MTTSMAKDPKALATIIFWPKDPITRKRPIDICYAKSERWDDAYKLLDYEMIKCNSSNIHQVMGQMIRGDYDDASNWQMVEYVLDNTEGHGLGLRFYNTLLEALWWLGQKERATQVLKEATKRGLFLEIFRNSKRV
ncbi:hypothetical protein Tco_0540931 [Tanacetum coccineum]